MIRHSFPIARLGHFSAAALRAVLGALVSQPPAERWAVLCYHAVRNDQRPGFARQMRTLAPVAVAAETVGAANRPPRPATHVCVTLDDGFVCLLENAVPALIEHHVPATIFAVAGYLGRRPDWPLLPEYADPGGRLLTAAELRSLPRDLVTVGSHGMTHPWLDRLPPDQARLELVDSKAALEDILGHPVRSHAFPYGGYNEIVTRLAYEAGYEHLFTIDHCLHPGPLPWGLISRFSASPFDNPVETRLKALGAYAWSHHLRRLRKTVSGTVS